MDHADDVEARTRARIRSLRQTHGWSLDELAERSRLSPSTISRIETGKRSISLDALLSLARALQVDPTSLLGTDRSDEVVIRPVPSTRPGMTVWPLTRPTGGALNLVKLILDADQDRSDPRVHPGHDWFFVLSGRVRLTLGDREIVVESGEAAEFATMTPHAIDAVDGPAELIMASDRDGACPCSAEGH